MKTESCGSVRHRVFTVIGIVLCVVLVPMLLVNCILIISHLTQKDRVPSVGGIFPMIVLTDSMEGTFDSGSLIICRATQPEKIQAGDIICFYDPQGNGTSTVTHRVVRVEKDEGGKPLFVTKGDANNVEDLSAVSGDRVLGTYRFSIPRLGSFALFMQSTTGVLLFVVLPVLLMLCYDLVRRRLYERQRDNDTDRLLAELEALRAEKAARQEEEFEEEQSFEDLFL